MKYLLLLFFLLPTVGWAGEPITGATSCANYFTAPNGGCVKPAPGEDELFWSRYKMPEPLEFGVIESRCIWKAHDIEPECSFKYQKRDCLATMEAAMRAMEPWIELRKVLLPDDIMPWAKAWEQWEIAKRCWRKP